MIAQYCISRGQITDIKQDIVHSFCGGTVFWIGMPTPFVEFSVPRRNVRYRGFASVVVNDLLAKYFEIFTYKWGSSCRDLPENDAETVDLGCFGESPVSKGFWCHVWYHAANVRETEFWFGSRECEVAQISKVA